MTPRIGLEEFRLLAECERQMDAGVTPFVVMSGQRIAMDAEALSDLGLSQGQSITPTMFGIILQYNLRRIEAQIAYERGQKLMKEES